MPLQLRLLPLHLMLGHAHVALLQLETSALTAESQDQHLTGHVPAELLTQETSAPTVELQDQQTNSMIH